MRLITQFVAGSLIAFISSSASVNAHTLGIMPTRTSVPEGRKTTVYMAWGHLLPVDEMVSGSDIETYRIHDPSGSKTDLKLEERSLQAHELTLDKPGLHQIEAVRKTGVFTMVKKSDGKTAFLRVPKSEVKLEPGSSIARSMRSTMYAKTIVLCGDAEQGSGGALGHRLEIVPAEGQRKFLLDQPIRMQVLFEGKPLADASVSATCVRTHSDGSSTVELKTDSEGRFEITAGDSGLWMFSVNHSKKATGEDANHFDQESIGATLTIGVEADSK
jgi:uncharacterized GH25 family protein